MLFLGKLLSSGKFSMSLGSILLGFSYKKGFMFLGSNISIFFYFFLIIILIGREVVFMGR
jgi:hypothetical protein